MDASIAAAAAAPDADAAPEETNPGPANEAPRDGGAAGGPSGSGGAGGAGGAGPSGSEPALPPPSMMPNIPGVEGLGEDQIADFMESLDEFTPTVSEHP